MLRSRSRSALGTKVVALMLALLSCALAPTVARPALASPIQQTMIQVLFADLPAADGVDANHDGVLTVADIVGLLFAGTIADLVPHAVGDQLVYRITDPLGGITTETTTATSSDAGGAFVIDDKEVDDHQQVITHEQQSYTDTGSQLLFNSFTDLVNHTNTICNPPSPLLRLITPLVAGQTFSTTVNCSVYLSSGVYVGFVPRTDTFAPKEVVDSLTVNAVLYTNVIHVSGTTNQSGDLENDEIYFAPGVGPILQLSTSGGYTTRHELIGGTIGGHPVGQ
ncbi:MAG: hypothetical protein ACHQ9S_04595 [Candidatus Binatia bacterium]